MLKQGGFLIIAPMENENTITEYEVLAANPLHDKRGSIKVLGRLHRDRNFSSAKYSRLYHCKLEKAREMGRNQPRWTCGSHTGITAEFADYEREQKQ